jgi:hypothetical protein
MGEAMALSACYDQTMKSLVPALICAAALTGCATTRSDCEFRLHDERERCLRSVEGQERADAERAKAKRAAEKPVALRKAEGAQNKGDPRIP